MFLFVLMLCAGDKCISYDFLLNEDNKECLTLVTSTAYVFETKYSLHLKCFIPLLTTSRKHVEDFTRLRISPEDSFKWYLYWF